MEPSTEIRLQCPRCGEAADKLINYRGRDIVCTECLAELIHGRNNWEAGSSSGNIDRMADKLKREPIEDVLKRRQ